VGAPPYESPQFATRSIFKTLRDAPGFGSAEGALIENSELSNDSVLANSTIQNRGANRGDALQTIMRDLSKTVSLTNPNV